MEEIETQETTKSQGEVFAETIKVISPSKKIFILTNNNQKLGPGDFISLVFEDKLVTRALVGKTHEEKVGIKILKIYSLTQWNKLRRGLDVGIILGDDSRFAKKDEKPKDEKKGPSIDSEDDLFNDKLVDGLDGNFDEEGKRHIKPDNLVSLGVGQFSASDRDGTKVGALEFSAGWAYQFADNFFAEVNFSRSLMNDFPGKAAQTAVNDFSLKLKYNFKAPLYVFFLPYIGFQSQSADSPTAAKGDSLTSQQRENELKAVDDLEKTGLVMGITVLRRLVPGWFLKLDAGTDNVHAGVSIEF